jgi:subtilisin-like proprotein convertase family protein
MGTRTLLAAAVASLTLAGPAAAGGPYTYTNTDPITIPAGAPVTTAGNANPYPSTIGVAGPIGGSITNVTVTLHDVTHSHPDDLDILLVSPSGDSVVVMSDACGPHDVIIFDWIFDDSESASMLDDGPCLSIEYRPTAHDGSSDTWPGPVPGPHGTTLARFDGENPNGIWSLYVRDDATNDSGTIAAWSLSISTGPASALIPGTGTAGPSSPYPHTVDLAGPGGTVATDVNVVFDGLSHQNPDNLDILLVGPQDQRTLLMSDACGAFDFTERIVRWNDEAPGPMTAGGTTDVCPADDYKPTDHEPGDAFAPPAPAGPHGTGLDVFDLLDPRGSWRAFIQDDSGGSAGFLIEPMELEISTRLASNVRFADSSLSIDEGSFRNVRVVRSGPPSMGPGTIRVSLTGGSASPGADFTDPSTTVSFAPGETEKTITLQSLADSATEPAESYTLGLSNATNDARPMEPSTLAVTIPGQPDVTKPAFALLSKRLVLRPDNTVRVTLRGPTNETAPSAARIVLAANVAAGSAARRVVLARKRATLQPARRTVIKLKLKRKHARLVRARGRLRTTLAATVTDSSGNAGKRAKRLRLRPVR